MRKQVGYLVLNQLMEMDFHPWVHPKMAYAGILFSVPNLRYINKNPVEPTISLDKEGVRILPLQPITLLKEIGAGE